MLLHFLILGPVVKSPFMLLTFVFSFRPNASHKLPWRRVHLGKTKHVLIWPSTLVVPCQHRSPSSFC